MYTASDLWYNDTMNARRYLTIITNLVVASAAAATVLLANPTVEVGEGGWTANSAGAKEQAAEVWASKPHNAWTVASLEAEGWTGCEPIDWDAAPDYSRVVVAHIVRLPVAEGWDWVRMDADEYRARTEKYGGTKSKRDDVTKFVANCF